ncbi:MAG: hypothetical protein GX936_00540 [Clostridiales bacterium]|jgi:hypothetical protein|nr:hypothetical protein [Clostridiales bacterium]
MTIALRKTLLAIAVSASALMIIALVITAVLQAASADTPAALTEAGSGDRYWLRSHNGHISVYGNKEDDSPIIETTIDVEGLRAVDRILLDSGIGAATYEDVLKLLEDFGS